VAKSLWNRLADRTAKKCSSGAKIATMSRARCRPAGPVAERLRYDDVKRDTLASIVLTLSSRKFLPCDDRFSP
jgi:hypothetical protein